MPGVTTRRFDHGGVREDFYQRGLGCDDRPSRHGYGPRLSAIQEYPGRMETGSTGAVPTPLITVVTDLHANHKGLRSFQVLFSKRRWMPRRPGRLTFDVFDALAEFVPELLVSWIHVDSI